jgi:hypothetical protein
MTSTQTGKETAVSAAVEALRKAIKIALVRHVFNATRRKEGDKMKLSILTVWLQQQDQWKLLARQAAKL